MKFIEQRIAQVEILFDLYKGQEPLHLFLKKYFKKHKKFGSRDRREIAECLYAVYRMGRENRHLSIRDRVFFYFFLTAKFESEFYKERYSELKEYADADFETKIKILREQYELRETFRTQEEISERIDLNNFRNSFYHEPLVYVRFRGGALQASKSKIEELGGAVIESNTVSFPQGVKLELHLTEKDYVVQDINSQRTANYFPQLAKGANAWDSCAGSGGKSILLLDKYPDIELVATDIRANILRNLIKRFEVYDLSADMIAEVNVNKEKELQVLEERKFDFILCDVPCTGSGTWARTPEQFYFFEKKEVRNFARRQLDILTNASRRLKAGGELLYITCSVFSRENEDVISTFLSKNKGFAIAKDAYLVGTRIQADTLYVCSLVVAS